MVKRFRARHRCDCFDPLGPIKRAVALALIVAMVGCTEFDYDRDRHLREGGVVLDTPANYQVQRGDTLYQIAWKFGLDFRDLARWNRIDAPYVIYPGQSLALKGSGVRTRASASNQASRAPAQSSGSGARSSGLSGPIAWQWPVEGEIIKAFSANALGKRGVSIAAPPGTPVKAAARGEVVYSGSGLRGYGNLLIVKHSDQFLTAYGYNQQLLVGEGDQVGAGQAIGRVGSSAERDGVLHFEVRELGKPVNPTRYLPASN
ncbi:MAG: peptidoglycan DD-metalloendopeptidase family protein [Spiribacter sp.]|nr:peptidoglycan DD-metalloendopeptidase family protein [Spiribacter sp.]